MYLYFARQWYRCQVLDFEKHAVVVKFVDYGNIDRVAKESVRKLLPDFAKHPWQGWLIIERVSYNAMSK